MQGFASRADLVSPDSARLCYTCGVIDQLGSSSSKEDLKKKVLEVLDLDHESMASASATQPEDEVDPFANEDMLDNFHPELYGKFSENPQSEDAALL
ncbi:hypothetical protein L3X38_025550 [Prunus dulcis]|uniref:Uncharacterized protein n=1 Tax=Prunus dulcis TaxID=3755 RepID=A0AAD4W4L6_PRUDU|nr:hypothetical protein L3X38_025550 [Prunus dulcis]